MEKIKILLNKIKKPKIFFLLFSFFLGLESYILGPFSYVQVGDNLETSIDRIRLAWNFFLLHGRVVYWLPALGGGVDRLSNLASFLEIGNVLFILPSWLASAIIITGGIFLGSFFTFRLCYEVLGFGKKASMTAGVLFSVFFLNNIVPFATSYAILPVVLFVLEKVFLSGKLSLFKKFISFLFLGVIYSFFTSLVLTLPFFSIAIFLWFVVVRKQRSPLFFLFLLFFFLPAALMKIQEALSLLANSPFSARGAGVVARFRFSKYVGGLKSCMQMGGLSVFIVILGSFFVKKTRLFWVLIVFLCVLIFVSPLFVLLSASQIGFILGPFRNFDLSRFYCLIPLFSVITAAYVFDKLKDFSVKISSLATERCFSFNVQKVAVVVCLIVVFYNCLSVKAGHASDWLMIGSYRTNTYSPDLAALARREKNAPPFRVATLSPQAVKRLYSDIPNFLGLETTDSCLNITSLRAIEYFRLMAKDPGVRNYLFFMNSLGNQKILELLQNFDLAEVANINLLSLANTRYIISDSKINSADFVLVDTPSAEGWRSWGELDQFEKIKLKLSEDFSGKKLLVYENKNYFPRFFLAKKLKVFDSKEGLLGELGRANLKTLRECVFVEKKDAAGIPGLSGNGEKINVISYSNDSIKMNIESGGPSVLVITNNFSPFWEAKVNGSKAQIFPAYHAFMGIFLSDKVSEVELTYNPPYKEQSLGYKIFGK